MEIRLGKNPDLTPSQVAPNGTMMYPHKLQVLDYAMQSKEPGDVLEHVTLPHYR